MKSCKLFISLFITTLIGSGFAVGDDILGAVEKGDIAAVQALLEKDPSLVGARNADSATPLHEAAAQGHTEIAELLISKSADVNARDNKQNTPLHLAAFAGHIEAARLLIEKGADIEAKESHSQTPLILAFWGGNLDLCKLLIEAGADINACDIYGNSVLLAASNRASEEMVNMLLDLGAEVPPAGTPDIAWLVRNATSTGKIRLFREILERNGGAILEQGKEYLVHLAAMGESPEMLRILLSKGLPADEVNVYGHTPLHSAASAGKIEAVRILLEHGVGLDTRTFAGESALNLAEEEGHAEIVELLAAKGAVRAPAAFPVLKGEYLGQPKSGGVPVRFAPGIVSRLSSEHSAPSFTPDGKEVYWTGPFRGPIMRMRLEGDQWTAPKRVPFNSEFGDGEPFVSPDGRRLFFLSLRPLQEGGTAGKENIWFVERDGDGWSAPQTASPDVNAYSLHYEVSLDAAGNLYFHSESGVCYGVSDIFFSEIIGDKHGPPKNLGGIINTNKVEITPFIAPDGGYLIYASDGFEDTVGRLDLYIAFRQEDGAWSRPVNLGGGINSPATEYWPIVKPDGKYLFFLSTRDDFTDVYWVEAGFIEKLRASVE